jgi:hypothetical protein
VQRRGRGGAGEDEDPSAVAVSPLLGLGGYGGHAVAEIFQRAVQIGHELGPLGASGEGDAQDGC